MKKKHIWFHVFRLLFFNSHTSIRYVFIAPFNVLIQTRKMKLLIHFFFPFRLQTQQSIDREADSTDEWKHDSPLELSGFKTPSFEPKIRKKDVFTSRSWGAGGLPFSVLYLNDALNNKHKNGNKYRIVPVHRI